MDGEKSSRRLFVGGLFQGISDQDLKDRFSRFGEVSGVDIRARKDNLGNILKTFAYLDMSISEKDYRKSGPKSQCSGQGRGGKGQCRPATPRFTSSAKTPIILQLYPGMATFNKTKWHGNEMQIQIAKESFVDRLKKEREEAAKLKTSPVKTALAVEPVEPLVKGAVPGTAVDGKKDWVIGKYGRALPVMNIRTKNKKKVVTVDPSKYVHGVKQFGHGKKTGATEERQAPVNGLTWHMDVKETNITKKIKGEFPTSKKAQQKRKHTTGSVQEKKADYHSSSDSCSSSNEEKSPVMKKKRATPAKETKDKVVDKHGFLTPQQSLSAKAGRKRTTSDTSTPTQSSKQAGWLSPGISLIEPMSDDTPTGINIASKASTILQQLKLSSQKKLKSSTTNCLKQKVNDSTDSSSDEDKVSNKPLNRKINTSKNGTANATKPPAQPCSDSRVSSDKKVATHDIPNKKVKSSHTPNLTPKRDREIRTQRTSDSSSSEDGDLKRRKAYSDRSKSTQPVQNVSVAKQKDVTKILTTKGKKKTPASATLTIDGETPEKPSLKVKKVKQKMPSTVPSPVLVKFDSDIGCEDDEHEDNSPKVLKPQLRLNQARRQPDFATVGSVDEFGVGMLVDDSTRVISEIERRWSKYNSGSFSSDEDFLDAASAGRFNKLDGIAKVAALRQKHIELPTAPNSVSLTTTRVYNSDSNDSDVEDMIFQKVQQPPKRVKQKTAQQAQIAETKRTCVSKTQVPKKASGFSSDSDDETSSDEDPRLKKAKGANSKKLVSKKLTAKPADDSSSDEEFQTKALPAVTSKKSTENTLPSKSSSVSSTSESSESSSISSASETTQPPQKMHPKPTQRNKTAKSGTVEDKVAESSSEIESSEIESSEIESSELEPLTSDVSDSDDEQMTQELQVQKAQVNIQINKDTKKQTLKSSSESKSSESVVKQVTLKLIAKNCVATSKEKNVTSSSESDSEKSQTGKAQVNNPAAHEMVTKSKSCSSSSESESSESGSKQITNKKTTGMSADKTKPKTSSESDSSESSSSESESSESGSKQITNKKTTGMSAAKTKLETSSESDSSESLLSESESPESGSKQIAHKKTPCFSAATTKRKTSPESDSSESDSDCRPQAKRSAPSISVVKSNKSACSDNDLSGAGHQQSKPRVNSVTTKQQKSKSSTSIETSKSQTEHAKTETKSFKITKYSSETSSDSSDSDSIDSGACKMERNSDKTTVISKPDKKKTKVAVPVKKAEKPKLTKKFGDANQQRLNSLKQRTQEALAQKNLLKQALASVDSDTSKAKKIIFDSDSDDEKMIASATPASVPAKRPVDTSSSDSGSGVSSDEDKPKRKKTNLGEKGPSLFAEESDESEGDEGDEDQFRVRPQFEGKAGSKLISMQSRFGNDPRFKFSEKFLDSDAEDESAEGSSEDEAEKMDEETTERDRSMAILTDVVGDKLTRKKKSAVFKDITMRQYDPTKVEHKQFEVQVEKKEKKKKVVAVKEAEPKPVPEVLGDKFFEVQTSLKDIFNTEGSSEKPFSLLNMLGRPDDQPAEKPTLQQDDGKGSVLKSVKSPWQQQFRSDDDSSDDEPGMDTESTSAPEVVKDAVVTRPAYVPHGFFFVENDPRIAKGIDFFWRRGDLEEIRAKWIEQRPELVEAYRNKRKRFKFMKRDANKTPYKPGGFQGGGRGARRGRGGQRRGRQ